LDVIETERMAKRNEIGGLLRRLNAGRSEPRADVKRVVAVPGLGISASVNTSQLA